MNDLNFKKRGSLHSFYFFLKIDLGGEA